MILTWYFEAGNEWITGEARSARAYSIMIDRFTSRVRTAQSRAGVATFVLDARQIESAFRANRALGATVRWIS